MLLSFLPLFCLDATQDVPWCVLRWISFRMRGCGAAGRGDSA
jgi:hypothetical protein